MKRFSITLAGESGQGINTIGDLVARALKETGYYTFGYREYPSLIKGGHARYQLDIADKPIHSAKQKTEILIALSRVSAHKYLFDVSESGVVIHPETEMYWQYQEQQHIQEQKLRVEYIPAFKLATDAGGSAVMSNMALLGLLWQILNLPLEKLQEAVTKAFSHKPDLLELNHKIVEIGFNLPEGQKLTHPLQLKTNPAQNDSLLISGNEAIGVGAVAAGVRALFTYPMTPASSILSYLANVSHQTGMLIKQAEDEITAVQMALGGMAMGTRTLVATSGGGFDLMTETLSLSGMIETPLVIVLAQRPGPATGLPSWTTNGDLNLALYAGHGEFPRAVLAASDAVSAYVLIQKAYNIAEEYQMPVIILTEKQIAESLFNPPTMPPAEPLQRGLVPQVLWSELRPEYRYGPTKRGVSLRWLPGQSDATYDLNSDEHTPDGSVSEEADNAKAQMEKRMRKLDSLLGDLPEPSLYGPSKADFTFVGWGSVKGPVLDLISEYEDSSKKTTPVVNYLHFEYLNPLKTERFNDLVKQSKHVVLIENNYQGQLGQLLSQKTCFHFRHRLLKYDGRPITVEEIKTCIANIRRKKKS